MGAMVSAGLEAAVSAVFFLPMYCILNKMWLHSRKKTVFCLIFSLYLAAVYILTGLPNVTYVRFHVKLNLIPLVDMPRVWKSSLLNVFLFVPFGMLLPLGWARYRRGFQAAAFGFLMSLTVELLQLFTYRATDVNDLITNTVGTGIGFLLAKPIAVRHLPIGKSNRDVYALWGLSFSVVFFLHPFLSPLIWDRIL